DGFSVERFTDGSTRLGGTLWLHHGRVLVLSQPFAIDHAKMYWDERHRTDAAIEVRVHHRYPDTTLVATVDGTLGSPDLHIKSDPPLREEFGIHARERVHRDVRVGGHFVLHGGSGDGTPGTLDVLWLLTY